DLQLRVTDQWKIRSVTLSLLDVVGPFGMGIHRVDAQTHDLDAALVELRLDLRHVTELRRTDGREVFGVREEHRPVVADPLVEANGAFGRMCLEIGSFVS